jgi:hypothetical protein
MYGLRVATVRNGRKKEKKQKTKIENENDTKTNKTTNEQHASRHRRTISRRENGLTAVNELPSFELTLITEACCDGREGMAVWHKQVQVVRSPVALPAATHARLLGSRLSARI